MLTMLTTPFDEKYSTFGFDNDTESGMKGVEGLKVADGDMDSIMRRYTKTAPPGADGLICTCSS